jgi:TolA-binding protein
LISLKDLDAAREEFETAILENPDDSTVTIRARFEMAHLEKMSGDPEKASKLYMLVAILYNDKYYCSEALFRAGEIFAERGNKEKAVKTFQEIVNTYKDSHVFEKAKEKLKVLNEN